MTDIVNRLRAWRFRPSMVDIKSDIKEAAAEIEKLRDAKSQWSKVAGERAIEVAALRSALGAITLAETIDHAREIARAALAGRAPG
jgi:hypothetical protein